MLRTDFKRQDLFNFNPSQKLQILDGVLNRLNGWYVPMGKSYEITSYREGTDAILSPDFKKSDIFIREFKISTKIEKIIKFTTQISLSQAPTRKLFNIIDFRNEYQTFTIQKILDYLDQFYDMSPHKKYLLYKYVGNYFDFKFLRENEFEER